MLERTEFQAPKVATVDEFCVAHRICRATFYNLLKDGQGPTVMKVRGRTLISDEAATAWRRRMEAADQHLIAA